MLKKELRIKREKDFSLVYKKGSFVGGSIFNINYIRNRYGFSRFGVVISKKNFKKAVDRNYIKRLVKEAISQSYAEVKEGYDVVVNIKKEISGKKLLEIQKELLTQLKRKDLLK